MDNALEDLINLSSRSIVRIRNSYEAAFFAWEGLRKWHLDVEHVTYRLYTRFYEGKDLGGMIKSALKDIEALEQMVEENRKALAIVYPDKNEYEIASMSREAIDWQIKENKVTVVK